MDSDATMQEYAEKEKEKTDRLNEMYKKLDLWFGDEDYFMKNPDKDMECGKSRKTRKY